MRAKTDPPNVKDGVHLNIGCGKKLWPGFVNIDFPGNWSGKKPDVECDIRTLPFDDGYADTAWAIHVVEHIQRWETLDLLKEWHRVLKDGGLMVVEVPCLDRVIKQFVDAFNSREPVNPQTTMWRLYGDPAYKDEHMVHKWCFSANELMQLMADAGYSNIVAGNPEYHHPLVDMRVTGTK